MELVVFSFLRRNDLMVKPEQIDGSERLLVSCHETWSVEKLDFSVVHLDITEA